MAYSGLRLEGGRNLRRTMKAAGDDMQDMKAIHRDAAGIVEGRASSWAPHLTGRLAGTLRTGATKTAAIVRAGNNRKSASGVPYAAPIHWGWRARNIKPNPFMSYSAQATESTWINLYFDAVNKAVDQIKGV